MSARPLPPPKFATDAAYGAGTDPWSGMPLRVEPSSGAKAGGLIPNTRPPAETLNWLLGLSGDWLNYLAEIPYTNWPTCIYEARVPVYGVTDRALYDAPIVRDDGTTKCIYSHVHRAWFALGASAVDGYYFGDSSYMSGFPTVSGSALQSTHGIATADGRIMVADHTDFLTSPILVDRSAVLDLTTPWTPITLNAGAIAHGAVGASCVKADGTIVMVGGVDSALVSWTSTDNGATFTEHLVAGPTGSFLALAWIREGKNGRLFCGLYADAIDGGKTIYYSDDNGTTWTSFAITGGSSRIRDLIYVAAYDQYFIFTGADGSAGLYGTTTDPLDNGAYTWTAFGSTLHILAADTDGSAIVFIVKDESQVVNPWYYAMVTNDMLATAGRAVVVSRPGVVMTGVTIAPATGGYQACINTIAEFRLSLKAGGP